MPKSRNSRWRCRGCCTDSWKWADSQPSYIQSTVGTLTRSVSEIASTINAALPNVKSGTLRLWGEWFGRPYDNFHRLTSCSAEIDSVVLGFDEGESLTISEPAGLVIEEGVFLIQSAARVRWEWFCYGRPKTQENRYFQEFANEESKITTATNVDWYSPNFSPSLTENAVEIL
jgi:hypothetical protein